MKTLRGFPAFLLILLVTCLSVPAVYADESSATTNQSLESKYEKLAASVYCYCGCERDTILTCVCGTAQQVENQFRDLLAKGETVEKIRNDYIAAYGTQYSAIMAAEGFNILAYVMPVIIIVLLGGVAFFVIKSKTGPALAKQPVQTEKNRTASEDVYKKIESEMERYKRER